MAANGAGIQNVLEVVFGTGGLMMMLYRLVRLIETHSQALASCLLDQVESSL